MEKNPLAAIADLKLEHQEKVFETIFVANINNVDVDDDNVNDNIFRWQPWRRKWRKCFEKRWDR